MRKSNKYITGLTLCLPLMGSAQNSRPNFVWMMTEDVSSLFVGLYNEGKGASLPNVEKMALEGLVFNNAYSNAPVSSAARSTLITGSYAPRLGISFHRKLEEVGLPEGMRMFPSYLRQAGYHTSNAAKTDYNCLMDTTAWDVRSGKLGEWRKRKDKNQPFFFVRTHVHSHESCLHFTEKQMKERKTKFPTSEVRLLPIHPDTELMRYTYATHYDSMLKADQELGQLMDMLREDDVLDNTFVFYFGDNGGSVPGSKGYTGEAGLKVPMVVYIPEKWRERLGIAAGTRVDGMVSFMDLGPTLLHLAGLEVPHYMDGTPFLGEDITLEDMNQRDVVYGYGDRYDELYAFNRTVRRGNLKYRRNFIPYHPQSLFAFYRYKQLAFREWKQMFEEGKLNAVQSRFFEPMGAEELYDLEADPNETRNLAALPGYERQVKELRSLLFGHMKEMNDLGILPECIWMVSGKECPSTFGKQSSKRIEKALEVANLQLLTYDKAEKEVKKALTDEDPVIRYWALTACISWGKAAKPILPLVKKMFETEKVAFLRSRAIVFFCEMEENIQIVSLMKKVLKEASTGVESLQILNDMAYLKESYPDLIWNMHPEDVRFNCTGTDWRVDYLK